MDAPRCDRYKFQVEKLDVLFRSCSRVFTFHGGNRVVDVKKGELTLTCLASLIASAEKLVESDYRGALRLTVLDDRSDESTVRGIRERLERCTFPTEFRVTRETGNGPSLRENYEHARVHCEGLVYFVEDDYLHDRNALVEMVDAFERFRGGFGVDPVIFPFDSPDRYRDPYPSVIVRGPLRYWRTVRHTGGTFMVSRRILDAHWERYLEFSQYGIDPSVTEDSTINHIYSEVPCLVPMPSLTVHLHDENSMPPFIPWQEWWESARGSA